MPSPSKTLSGILCLVAGLAVFSVQDLILKQLSGGYPLHQAMVIRSLTALPLLILLVLRDGKGLAAILAPGWQRLFARGFILFLAYTSYYLALAALPLATTVALYFSAPLMMVALAAFLLGDRVGPARWLAVGCGFAGVVVMVRPGSSLFDWAALLPVFSGLSYALSMVLARRMGMRHSAAVLAFHGNAVFLLCALLLSAVFGGGGFAGDGHPSLAFLTRGWVVPTPGDLGLMMACGGIAAAGLTLLTQAYRIAPTSTVAPFEYSAMIWGVLWGWLFWSDWPDAVAWTGIAIICGTGLFVVWHEAREQRAAGRPAPAA